MEPCGQYVLKTTGSAKHKNAKRAAKVVHFFKKPTVRPRITPINTDYFFLENQMANGLA